MQPFGLQLLIAFPRNGEIEPREQRHAFKASQEARAGVLQHPSGFRLHAQINSDIKCIWRKMRAQFQQFIFRHRTLAFARAGVEEGEFMCRVDTRFKLGQSQRGLGDEDVQFGIGEALLQPP